MFEDKPGTPMNETTPSSSERRTRKKTRKKAAGKKRTAAKRKTSKGSRKQTAQPRAEGPVLAGSDAVTIEKAILADVCLGIPLGRIRLPVAASRDPRDLPAGPDTCLFRSEHLALLKSLNAAGEKEINEAIDRLCQVATRALEIPPQTVTAKKEPGPSGSLNDYHSLAKYWWPSEDSAEGHPYYLRDGEVNPDVYDEDRFDYLRLVRFSETVVLLALTAYLADDERYAAHAVKLLRTWFVDETTRQNPDFIHAQQVPGKTQFRWQGLIEARFLVYVTEAIRLLDHTGAIPADDRRAIGEWFAQLLAWMDSSDQASKAQAARNNIGFWYDLQRMVYADFCGEGSRLDAIVRESVVPRLEDQLGEDGSLATETARSYPHDYVAFSLAAMALISRAGEEGGVSLWDQEKSDGRNFQVAHDWLLRAANSRQLLGDFSDSGIEGGGYVERELLPLMELGLQIRGVESLARRRGHEIQRLEAAVAESEQRAEAAQQSESDLKGQQEELAKERKRATQELEKQQSELKALSNERDQLRKDMDKYRAETISAYKEFSKEKTELIQKLTAAQVRLEYTEDRLKEREQESQERITSLEKERDELREARDTAKDKLENTRTELKGRIAKLEERLATEKSHREELDKQRATLEQKANSVEQERGEAQKQLTQLQEEYRQVQTALESRINELSEQYEQEHQHRLDLEQAQAEFDAERKYLQAQIDAGNAMWTRFQERSDELAPEVKSYRQKFQRIEAELERSKDQLEEARENEKLLKSRLEQADKKSQQLASQLEQAEEERNKAQTELAEREEAFRSDQNYLQAQVDAGNAMWEHYRKQAEQAQEELKTARSELKSLRNEQKKMRQEADRWRREAEKRGANEKRLKAELSELRSRNHRLSKDLEETAKYALTLQGKIQALLKSRTWRMMAPIREMSRLAKGVIRRQRVPRTELPEAPPALRRDKGGKK